MAQITAQTLIANGVNPAYAKDLAAQINTLDPSVQPRFAATVVDFYQTYGKQGYDLDINQAARTVAEQQAIRATGVKAASPKNTWHVGGGAADFTVLKNGVKDKGTTLKNAYDALLKPIAQRNGLNNPIKNDVGHFQPKEVSKARGGQAVAAAIDPNVKTYVSLFGRGSLVAEAPVAKAPFNTAGLDAEAYAKLTGDGRAVAPQVAYADVPEPAPAVVASRQMANGTPITQAALQTEIPPDDLSLGRIDVPRQDAQVIEPTDVPRGPFGSDAVVNAAMSGDPARLKAALDATTAQVKASLTFGESLKAMASGGALPDRVTANFNRYFGAVGPDGRFVPGQLSREAPGAVRAVATAAANPRVLEAMPPGIRPQVEAALRALPPSTVTMPVPQLRPPMAAEVAAAVPAALSQPVPSYPSREPRPFGPVIDPDREPRPFGPVADQYPSREPRAFGPAAPPLSMAGYVNASPRVGKIDASASIGAGNATSPVNVPLSLRPNYAEGLGDYRPMVAPSVSSMSMAEFQDRFDPPRTISRDEFSQRFDPQPDANERYAQGRDQYRPSPGAPMGFPASASLGGGNSLSSLSATPAPVNYPTHYPTGNSPISPELGITQYQPPDDPYRYTAGVTPAYMSGQADIPQRMTASATMGAGSGTSPLSFGFATPAEAAPQQPEYRDVTRPSLGNYPVDYQVAMPSLAAFGLSSPDMFAGIGEKLNIPTVQPPQQTQPKIAAPPPMSLAPTPMPRAAQRGTSTARTQRAVESAIRNAPRFGVGNNQNAGGGGLLGALFGGGSAPAQTNNGSPWASYTPEGGVGYTHDPNTGITQSAFGYSFVTNPDGTSTVWY